MTDYSNIGTDRAAEEATIAAGLHSLAARKEARRHIGHEDFYEPACADIWHAMGVLDRNRQPVDPTTVRTALAGNKAALEVLIRVMAGHHAMPDNMAAYAEAVRGWAVRRRVDSEAIRARQMAVNEEVDALGLASLVAARFAQVRDSGAVEDVQSITLAELLASPDDEPEWVIPGLLERRDRFMLTGSEGLGKSYLLRQIAIMAAAGLDPFDMSRIEPRRVLIIDCENSLAQVKRKSRAVVELAQRHGKGNAGQVNLVCCGRIDILRDKDLAMLHREVDAIQPEVLVIGPLYAMSPKALMTDDDAVPVLAALDGLRESGAALLMEAHAGHAAGPDGRNFRPRGSSSLLGWPEFGYGMKPVATNYADLVPWRGDRDARSWPRSLRHDRDGIRWVPHDGKGHDLEPERAGWSPSSAIRGATA